MDKPIQEEQSIMQDALNLKQNLIEVLSLVREPMPTTESKLAVPQSSLKLDNLRNTILDCKEITDQIAKGLRLLI